MSSEGTGLLFRRAVSALANLELALGRLGLDFLFDAKTTTAAP